MKDLLESASQGFDSTELMKRFSTLGMGPSQGKHANLHGARILMRSRDATLADTALTTQRPFYHPVPLKHLAGMGFHPHRHSGVHDRHVALDANFMTVGGWQRPEFYRVSGQSRADCIAAEVSAVRGAAGLIDVSTLGKIEIFGPDAGAFLDRIYTGSFSDLRVGMTRYGLLLDEGGIVRDDGVIARLADQHFYFTTTTSAGGQCLPRVAVVEHALAHGLRVRQRHGASCGVQPRGAEKPRRCCSRSRTSTCQRPHSRSSVSAKAAWQASRRACCAPVSFHRSASKSTFLIEAPARSGMRSRTPAGCVRSASKPSVYCASRKVTPSSAQDTDNLTNPFEAGMGWAVRMQKPFFVGQRSLRIHMRRGARQKLIGFELAPEQVASGAAIHESNLLIHLGGIAGRVTSVAQSPTLGRTIGLAMAAPHLASPGTPIVIRASDGRLVSARVVRTPFLEAA